MASSSDKDKVMEIDRLERIDWCDIFKGIVIILVVVGHATGKFNQYIYQFHMAAFFFISGFTSKRKNSSLIEDYIKKFYKLKCPFYIIAFFGITLFWIFSKCEILSIISTTQYPASYYDALAALFKSSTVYCDWLGAIWFLPVLFWTSVIFATILKLSKNDCVFCLISIVLFVWGIKMATGNIYCYGMDLPCIALAFMAMGYLYKRYQGKIVKEGYYFIKILLICIVWGLLLQLGFKNVVDWPVRRFNGITDLFLPIPGIFLVINIAKLLSGSRYLKQTFIELGKNSMGIMCFHFIGFKVAYVILVLFHEMKKDEIYNLVPPMTVKNDWWLLICIISIIFSLLFWKVLHCFSFARLLLGSGDVSKYLKIITETKIFRQSNTILLFLIERIVTNPMEKLKRNKHRKKVVVIGFAVVLMLYVFTRYDIGKIEVTFPYKKSMVSFDSGWYAQSSNENYRWIDKKSEFTTYIIKQNNLNITGYIPDNVENMSYISIKINGVEICREQVSSNQQIDICMDISKYTKAFQKNTFEIEMDGVRVIKETDVDLREFSALINSILIY